MADDSINLQNQNPLRPTAESDPDSRSYLLILRCFLINMVGLFLTGVAYVNGWVHALFGLKDFSDFFEAVVDPTGLAFSMTIIFFVFLVGLCLCISKIFITSRELNEARRLNRNNRETTLPRIASYLEKVRGKDAGSRQILAATLAMRYSSRLTMVQFLESSLLLLGLLGTVFGFVLALSGVDPKSAGDVSAIQPMVAMLVDGMSIALYTTLLGSVLYIWFRFNYLILKSGTANLVATMIDLGEELEEGG